MPLFKLSWYVQINMKMPQLILIQTRNWRIYDGEVRNSRLEKDFIRIANLLIFLSQKIGNMKIYTLYAWLLCSFIDCWSFEFSFLRLFPFIALLLLYCRIDALMHRKWIWTRMPDFDKQLIATRTKNAAENFAFKNIYFP